MKRAAFLIILVALGVTAWFGRGAIPDWLDAALKPDLPEAQPADTTSESSGNENANSGSSNANENRNVTINVSSEPEPEPATRLPKEANLDVPFTSQAPHANWDLPYQEACEEAAALMVHRFWENKPFASKDDADTAIREIVDFQEREYGSYKDTDADETARFIRDLWGYDNVAVVTGSSVTADRIRREVADGFPVIVLAAGRQLGNPNFTSPGPIYHALVVKGYTRGGQFITNDPGTRKGADYLYDEAVLMNAIHEWNGGDVENGQRAIVIVRK